MDKVRKINRMIGSASHHREQLHAIAREFVRMHDEEPGSCEADELMHVILDGEDYTTAMKRVLRIKKHRSR